MADTTGTGGSLSLSCKKRTAGWGKKQRRFLASLLKMHWQLREVEVLHV
jgi:hypothetical protein